MQIGRGLGGNMGVGEPWGQGRGEPHRDGERAVVRIPSGRGRPAARTWGSNIGSVAAWATEFPTRRRLPAVRAWRIRLGVAATSSASVGQLLQDDGGSTGVGDPPRPSRRRLPVARPWGSPLGARAARASRSPRGGGGAGIGGGFGSTGVGGGGGGRRRMEWGGPQLRG